ncbi:oxidoreductase NAD-binding rossmann fold-containing protein [Colletotrichum truncatum]|uniref:Oxidoreductase NAD-binding rossmann fold-containing protein n=1 Tax=Colletotrichum truncatum TaxID=5467 RepID=A0ACC3ZDD9_COLTU|nr:oxidoreductase NAD-binding rossmann fold-containing protein [Colletotrichum truncatum]KAF6794704.1 oxidoreductase NAD-binding rossmann fold-containing protein [Colletotrichum truncatum]
MAPIGVAIVGGGIFAKEQHLPAVEASDQLVLKAIYSRSRKSAEDTASLVTKSGAAPDLYSDDSGAGNSFKDLLARDDIKALILALPIMSQPEYIEQALAAGKHVLAEKPIAADVARARKLIDYYKKVSAEKGVTFAVAENYRFQPRFTAARDEVQKLGKVIGFNARIFFFVALGGKYIETAWRKKPDYQGGFLLDGGVHFAAALRLLLGREAAPGSVAAFSDLTREHLPPIDTVNAIVKTKSGATGFFAVSVGSSLKSFDFQVACENGSVTVSSHDLTVAPMDGEARTTHFEETTGVKEEVKAWAEALSTGKQNPLQSPQEALADLEFLEKIFKSGEQDGALLDLELQQ